MERTLLVGLCELHVVILVFRESLLGSPSREVGGSMETRRPNPPIEGWSEKKHRSAVLANWVTPDARVVIPCSPSLAKIN